MKKIMLILIGIAAIAIHVNRVQAMATTSVKSGAEKSAMIKKVRPIVRPDVPGAKGSAGGR